MENKIDYSTMTEQEFFDFLDQEEKRIRENSVIRPLSNYHLKLSKIGTELSNNKKTKNGKRNFRSTRRSS